MSNDWRPNQLRIQSGTRPPCDDGRRPDGHERAAEYTRDGRAGNRRSLYEP